MEHITSTKLTEMSVSANLNPRQCSYLEKLWRELNAISSGKKAADLGKNYNLVMIRRIRAKQEEIKEFLQTKKTENKIIETVREQLIEWAKNELGRKEDGAAEGFVDETFDIKDDGSITAVTDLDFTIDDHHSITQSLRSLPDNLTCQKNLILPFCYRIIYLPENLRVDGKLDLYQCRNLKILPKGLVVGGDLDIRAAVSLAILPDDMRVGGFVYCDTRMQAQAQRLKERGNIVGGVRGST